MLTSWVLAASLSRCRQKRRTFVFAGAAAGSVQLPLLHRLRPWTWSASRAHRVQVNIIIIWYIHDVNGPPT